MHSTTAISSLDPHSFHTDPDPAQNLNLYQDPDSCPPCKNVFGDVKNEYNEIFFLVLGEIKKHGKTCKFLQKLKTLGLDLYFLIRFRIQTIN